MSLKTFDFRAQGVPRNKPNDDTKAAIAVEEHKKKGTEYNL